MPIKWEDGAADDPEYPEDRMMTIEFFTEGPIGAPATVTVKPSLDRYAVYTPGGHPVFGQLGQEVTFDATAANNGLYANFGVADSGNIDTATEILHIRMNVGPER